MFSKKGRTPWAALAVSALTACTVLSAPAVASDETNYPEKDIKFIVPFGPGGGSDVLSRTIASVIKSLDLLSVELLIENRPGGSGAVGYKMLADQAGNPHFLGTVSVSFFTTPLMGGSPVNYQDFTPVAAIAMAPYILAVRPDSKYKTMEDLAASQRLTTSTVGTVSDAALLSQMLEEELSVQIDAVPFDGEGEALAALLGDHIDYMFGNPGEILPQIKAGELRPIAVTTKERIQSLPETPTLSEQGYNVVHTQLRGVVMPNDVPEEAVAFWEDTLRKVTESDEWQQQYIERYMLEPYYLGSEDFGETIDETNRLYKEMMVELGIIEG